MRGALMEMKFLCDFLLEFVLLFFNLCCLLCHLFFQFLIFLNQLAHCLYTPIMELKSKILLKSRVLIKEHIIDSIFIIFGISSITIVFYVHWITFFFKSITKNLFLVTIKYYSFIDRSAGHDVFHSSYDLKSIFIQLLTACQSGCTELILFVILVKECFCNICEVKVINVM